MIEDNLRAEQVVLLVEVALANQRGEGLLCSLPSFVKEWNSCPTDVFPN
jgi:hypothetical protein